MENPHVEGAVAVAPAVVIDNYSILWNYFVYDAGNMPINRRISGEILCMPVTATVDKKRFLTFTIDILIKNH